MKRAVFFFWLITCLLGGAPRSVSAPRLDTPRPGDALQGVVTITGSTDLENFRSAEVAFRYESDPENTWFLIQQSSQPVSNGPLAQWDTTTIADGSYRLRLQVLRSDGSLVETQVSGLRVRNYSPVETATPGFDPAAESPGVTPSPTATLLPPTPTPFPPNPAQVTPEGLAFGLLQGGILGVALFLILAIVLAVRSLARRR